MLRLNRPSIRLAFCGIRQLGTIPQPPGHVTGTVNDAFVPPKADKKHGSLHWTSERVVAIAMVPLAVAPLVTGSTYAVADSVLASLLLVHCHAGFSSCITDYIPLRVYGKFHNFAMYLLTFGGLVSAYGIYQIESKEEEGLIGVLKKVWKA